MKHAPDTRIEALDWIPRARQSALTRLGLHTLADMVLHFPRRYEDRRGGTGFPSGATHEPVLIRGMIVKTGYLPFGKWRKGYEATVREIGDHALAGEVVLRWFNMPFVAKSVAAGFEIFAYGKTKIRGRRVIMDFPEYELLDDDSTAQIHVNRIVPMHPAGEGVSPKKLREWIFRALECCDLDAIASVVPGTQHLPQRGTALREIHFPTNNESLQGARDHLVFEELFQMQALLASRRAVIQHGAGIARTIPGRMFDQLLAGLPFAPTSAQQRAIAEIRSSLAAPSRMHRLLQGDVGSGKTLVAAAAALDTMEAGFRVAILAPTQILANQHWETFKRWFEPLGIQVALKTGTRSEALAPSTPGLFDSPIPVVPGLPTAPQVVIGTHALLYGETQIPDLGLIVIDEQHKFGVMQRAKLATSNPGADILVLTATPIPRTLAQTAYGDLDVTTLDELPAGRGKIITAVRPASKLKDAAIFIKSQIEAGRQAYIVYPLIDESEKVAAKAARDEFKRWSDALAPFVCGLLHGRMDAAEKSAVMENFRNRSVHALIATTVIEVGIDVPNANIMLIENAERFGLAQLHQLRGRVGRGEHKSYCVLIPGNDDDETMERLKILERTTDGFVVAEEDLRLRGPGDILGIAQTGLPPLRLANLATDGAVLARARQNAIQIFAADPELRMPEHQSLKTWIDAKTRAMVAADG